MDLTTIGICGGILIVVVAFFSFKNRSQATKMLHDNQNVAPLMQQKATQIKVNRLLQATQQIPAANKQLHGLIASYKNDQISILEYNQELDNMISNLEIDL